MYIKNFSARISSVIQSLMGLSTEHIFFNTQMSHILNIVPIGTIEMHFFIIIITPIERSL